MQLPKDIKKIGGTVILVALLVGGFLLYSMPDDTYVPAQGKLSIAHAELVRDIMLLHAPETEWSWSSNTASMKVPLSGHYVALWSPATFSEIQVGEVVIFRVPNDPRTFCHMVVERTGEALLVKGTGNIAFDGWITEPQVLGTLDMVIFHRSVHNPN